MTAEHQDEALLELRQYLLQHPVYQVIGSMEDLRMYTAYHVFAVWDFMSLLKRLQHDLTGTAVPWLPRGQEPYTRFVNEIVVGEESDEAGGGRYQSHFCLYLDAMEQIGADSRVIRGFLEQLRHGAEWSDALDALEVDERVKAFVRFDLGLAQNAATHEVAAAFFYGREDIIPEMFLRIIGGLGHDNALERLRYYLQRHIEIDTDSHGPLASRLVRYLCGDDQDKTDRAAEIARQALRFRIGLFDAVADRIARRRAQESLSQ